MKFSRFFLAVLFGILFPVYLYAADNTNSIQVPVQTGSSQNPSASTNQGGVAKQSADATDPGLLTQAEREQAAAVTGYMTDWSAQVGKKIMDHVKNSLDQALQEQEAAMPSVGGSSDLIVSPNGKEYFVSFDLPGVSKEDTKVEIKDGILYVVGMRKSNTETSDKKSGYEYSRQESSSSTYKRSVKLPPDADLSQIKAEQKDGVLKIRFGKLQTEKSKVIKVAVQ